MGDQAKRLKELERENTRLKKLVADQALDNMILKARISDFAVVPYGQDSPARLDFWGSDVGNPATTEGDTLWVNYSMRRFSSRSMAS